MPTSCRLPARYGVPTPVQPVGGRSRSQSALAQRRSGDSSAGRHSCRERACSVSFGGQPETGSARHGIDDAVVVRAPEDIGLHISAAPTGGESTSLSLRWFGASVPAISTAMPSPISHCAVRGRVLSMRSLANEPVLGLSTLAGRFAVIRVRPEVLLSHPCHLLRSSFERVCDVVHWIHRQPACAVQRTWVERHTSRVGLAAQALVLDDDTEGLHLAVPRIVMVGSCLGLKSSASRKGRLSLWPFGPVQDGGERLFPCSPTSPSPCVALRTRAYRRGADTPAGPRR